jgi:aminomethyltransferase
MSVVGGGAGRRAQRVPGPARQLWGLRASGRGIPRPGMAVLDGTGARVGEVTSGTFSPTLRAGIGLALLDTAAQPAPGLELAVDVRGRTSPVEVVKPPFVESHVR